MEGIGIDNEFLKIAGWVEPLIGDKLSNLIFSCIRVKIGRLRKNVSFIKDVLDPNVNLYSVATFKVANFYSEVTFQNFKYKKQGNLYWGTNKRIWDKRAGLSSLHFSSSISSSSSTNVKCTSSPTLQVPIWGIGFLSSFSLGGQPLFSCYS